MFLGKIAVSENLDAPSALGAAVLMGLLALGLRLLTVRLERKFVA